MIIACQLLVRGKTFSPYYALRMSDPNKTEQEYLEMDPNGVVSLVSVNDLGSNGPHQFLRINNDDGTISLHSKTHNRLVEAESGSCNRTKFAVRRQISRIWKGEGEGETTGEKSFKMLSCNNDEAFISGRGWIEYEFESNWFYGHQFFVIRKRSDGSAKVLLAQTEEFSFEMAEISGSVISDENPKLERMLKVDNLYRHNTGRYHLNITGKKVPFCCEGLSEYVQSPGKSKKCRNGYFSSLMVQKPLTELLPKLFASEQDYDKDIDSNLAGTKSDGSQIALPLTYFGLESAMGVECECGEGDNRNKFVLVIVPGQSVFTET